MGEQVNFDSDEMTLKDFFEKILEWWIYIKTQLVKIFVVGFIGASVGFIYAGKQPINYKAKLTFIVEEGKSSGSSLGGLASLAGQFGVDVGVTNGGVLTGDNILLYFKSPSLARKVLLSKYDSASNETVADFYADVYKLKKEWVENNKIGTINFHPLSSNKPYTRLQDSLLQEIISKINSSQFELVKVDKKASFIEATATMQNESLAQLYCERIVNIAIETYLSIKMQRQMNTVNKLQSRVDSISKILNIKTVSGASLQTNAITMDINPLYKSGAIVANETTLRDKTMLSAIFASVTQNLEMAKFTLSQETPVIEIVDKPILPLRKDKIGKLKTSITFSFLSVLFLLIILVVQRLIKTVMN